MKYVIADPTLVRVPRENWEKTFILLRDKTLNSPTVGENNQNHYQALLWLECVCKTHPADLAGMCVEQLYGLGSKEMRSLMAHEEGEYYPALSPIEIYQSKQLKAFPVDFKISVNEERFILNATRASVLDRAKGERQKSYESRMFKGGNQWFKSRPAMCFSSHGEDYLADIHVNRSDNVTASDEIRMHYHSLVASSVGLPQSTMLQVNVKISPDLKAQLAIMANTSPECEELATKMLIETFKGNPALASIETSVIPINAGIHNRLITVGKNHWANIVSGQEMKHTNNESKLELSSDLKEEFKSISKRLLVTSQMASHIKSLEKSQRKILGEFAIVNGIRSNMDSPYEATQLREYNEPNLDALEQVLVQEHGVEPLSLKKREIDQTAILKLIDSGNVTPEAVKGAISYAGNDKEIIIQAADAYQIDINEYSDRSIRPYISGQSRGPVADAIAEIKSTVQERSDYAINSLANSAELEQPNLVGKLKNTGVSLTMEQHF